MAKLLLQHLVQSLDVHYDGLPITDISMWMMPRTSSPWRSSSHPLLAAILDSESTISGRLSSSRT
jgi:hypothetical protein